MAAKKSNSSGELRGSEREGYYHHSDDSRYSEERDKQIRQQIAMDHRNFLNNTPEPPEGYRYYWGRINIREGEPDSHRIGMLNSLGWDPVPADRHPEFAGRDFFDRNSYGKNYIVHRDCMLLERPIKYDELEERKREEESARLLNEIPYRGKRIGTPGGIQTNNTNVSFGPGPGTFGM
jgi:peptidoglycan/xylan/chitin deacetylase (PgdA/CDA1 family)